MAEKRLVVFYNVSDDSNKKIAKKDWIEFFEPLYNNYVNDKNLIKIQRHNCLDAAELLQFIDQELQDNESKEFYFHFSGHGNKGGIPYAEWNLSNHEFTSRLKDDRIKFCFFSSCQGGELVDIANQRGIPVIIGTNHNNIDNDYAIQIQIEFYKLLLSQKLTFENAFENAILNVKTNSIQKIDIGNLTAKKKVEEKKKIKKLVFGSPLLLHRGGGNADNLDENVLNDLQIIFNAEADKKRRLLSKNIEDQLNEILIDSNNNNINNPKVLISYFDDRSIENDFEINYKSDYEEFISIIYLKDHDLSIVDKLLSLASDSTNTAEENLLRNFSQIKFLIQLTSMDQINVTLKDILISNNFWTNPKVKIAFLLHQQLYLSDLFKQNHASKLITYSHKIATFKFTEDLSDVFNNLESQSNLSNYITDESIPNKYRYTTVINFDCGSQKGNIQKLIDIPESSKIRLIFGIRSHEKFMSFLANWLKFKNKQSQFLIINRAKSSDTLRNTFEHKIRMHLGNDINNRNKIKGLLSQLINRHEQTIFIIKGCENKQEYIDEIIELIEIIQSTFQDVVEPEKPFYIFFLDFMRDTSHLEFNNQFSLCEFKTLTKPSKIKLCHL